MSVTQYIGSRYVPVFADPIEWDNTKTYEPLTIVTHDGNSYTSAQYVPKGIDIANTSYWKLTGNYNAQVEQYRKEVANYDSRITTADNTANDALSLAQTNEQDIATLDAQMAGTEDSELKNSIDTVATLANKCRLKKFNKAVTFGDSWERGFWGTSEHMGKGWLSNACKVLGVPYVDEMVADGEGYRTGNILNMSVSGSGFDKGITFKTRLNQVTDSQWADVDLILIGGGVNDTAVTGSRNNLILMVQELCNRILPLCSPNCEVHFFVGNIRKNATFDQMQIISSLNIAAVRACGYTGSMYAGQSICVHTTIPDWMHVFTRDDTDAVHLSETGYQNCGSFIASCVMSGGSPEYNDISRVTNINSAVSASENRLFTSGSITNIELTFTATNDVPVGTVLCVLPSGYAPNQNMQFGEFYVVGSDASIRNSRTITSDNPLACKFSVPAWSLG